MTIAAPTVRILVCGSADRGDDGAALAALAHLLPTLSPEICARIEVRRCVQLDAADLVDVGPAEACVIADTAVGVPAGTIVTIPIADLARRSPGVLPRSSHALPAEQVLLVAEAIRGTLPEGTFVGIGGKWFGYGTRFSRAVKAGLPALQDALLAEIVRLTGADVLAAAEKATADGPASPCVETLGPVASTNA